VARVEFASTAVLHDVFDTISRNETLDRARII